MKQLLIRRWILAGIIVAVVVVFIARLMEVQIINAAEYKRLIDGSYISTQVVRAARGEIVDRNGRPVTVNRMGYDIVIDKAWLPQGEEQNDVILRLMALCDELEEDWFDSLPISLYQPFAFLPEQEAAADRLRAMLGVQSYASVEDVIYRLIEQYGLEEYSPLDQRRLAAVRYEMELRGFDYNVPYTFATDVNINSVVRVKEHSYELSGVDIAESATREYADGTLAPHVIGTVGPIYQEEYPALKEQGYAMDDIVGKDGIEKAFESVLRGQNGRREIHLENGNVVLRAEETQAPVPGNTI
ncbi:MAG: hypothetical protein LBU86_01850, partial [Oscillospiraceae bacterium]|nr:hypothetical protein [Oscillospiraceae bacterium]